MEKEEKESKPKWPIYLSLSLLGMAVLLYFVDPSVRQFFTEGWEVLTSEDEQKISQWVEQFSWWGPVIIVLAMIAQIFLLVVPTPLLMVVTVLAYGPFAGTGIILLAIFCASSIAYGIGRFLGTSITEKILGGKSMDKVEVFLEEYGFWAVIVTRISPFLSNDAISFVAGLLGMGYWRFIGATMLGIFPLTLFIAFLGESNDRLKTGLIWIGIISLIGFSVYVWWDKKKR